MSNSSRPKSVAAGALVTSAGIYAGFVLRETTGAAAATVQLYDNANAGSGVLLDTINLPQGTDDRFEFQNGVWFTAGIFVVITGTVEGSILIA